MKHFEHERQIQLHSDGLLERGNMAGERVSLPKETKRECVDRPSPAKELGTRKEEQHRY